MPPGVCLNMHRTPHHSCTWHAMLQGENAWVFVHEDDIADAVKHYFQFADDLEKEAKANAPKGTEPPPPTSLSCAVMDGKVLAPADVSAGVCLCDGGMGRGVGVLQAALLWVLVWQPEGGVPCSKAICMGCSVLLRHAGRAK